MEKTVIAVSGELASGKDTATEYLVAKFQAEKLGFSDVFRDILDRLYLPHTRPNMSDLAQFLRATFGESVISETLVRDAQKSEKEMIVIDGVRKIGELEYLQKLPRFYSIYVKQMYAFGMIAVPNAARTLGIGKRHLKNLSMITETPPIELSRS